MIEKILIVEDQFIEANDLRFILEKSGYCVCGIAKNVPAALKMIEKEKPGVVLVDAFFQGTAGIKLSETLRREGITFLYTYSNANREELEKAKKNKNLCYLVKPYKKKDLLKTLEQARYKHENGLTAISEKEEEFKKKLKMIGADKISHEEKMLQMAQNIQGHIPFDFIYMGFDGIDSNVQEDIGFNRIGFNEYQKAGIKELQVITNLEAAKLFSLGHDTQSGSKISYYNGQKLRDHFNQPSLQKLIVETFRMESHLMMPLLMKDKRLYKLYFFSRRPEVYNTTHLQFAEKFKNSLSSMLEKVLEPAETTTQDILGFEGIIGKSNLLLNVFEQIRQVAPLDTSVLILGESGTGKERIADCIHNLSSRKKNPFVKISCAALPAGLIESELFGHEKGAFTGAVSRKIGKFEMAHKGTLFLDEIGEMPLELQTKLLRVLQEKEIDRIGGDKPIKIDVRIIAATNRVLEKEVAEGRFRLDLYYRLSIFPIQLPALRDRLEDLPLLINHFIKIYNEKCGKAVTGVFAKVLQQFMVYNWPGNIRELENLIQRSVILSRDTVINEVVMPNFGTSSINLAPKSIQDNERSHIIEIVKKCRGKISGVGGAAEILKVPHTTLNSKMKKLGIQRNNYTQ